MIPKDLPEPGVPSTIVARNGFVIFMKQHLETSEQVEDELRDAVVCRNRQIHHNLYYEEHIDAATEVVVHLLLFTGFFKSHSLNFVTMGFSDL